MTVYKRELQLLHVAVCVCVCNKRQLKLSLRLLPAYPYT